jgi:hypothetical protein
LQEEIQTIKVRLSLQDQWGTIDKIISSQQYKGFKVSGDIFLYPRQTSMLTALFKLLANKVKPTD